MQLTTRQQEVLDFIEESQTHHGLVPSTREIQQHFGFASQTAAVNHLRALERKGVIQRHAGKARSVALVSNIRRETIIDIPIHGAIPAGMSETGEPNGEGMVSIDAATIKLDRDDRVFALKARGDSMIDAGIADGDLVIFEHRAPKPGAIVAALIDGETTLKRFVIEHGRPHLKAENSKYPNLIPVGELIIQGVMVALIRRCRN